MDFHLINKRIILILSGLLINAQIFRQKNMDKLSDLLDINSMEPINY